MKSDHVRQSPADRTFFFDENTVIFFDSRWLKKNAIGRTLKKLGYFIGTRSKKNAIGRTLKNLEFETFPTAIDPLRRHPRTKNALYHPRLRPELAQQLPRVACVERRENLPGRHPCLRERGQGAPKLRPDLHQGDQRGGVDQPILPQHTAQDQEGRFDPPVPMGVCFRGLWLRCGRF